MARRGKFRGPKTLFDKVNDIDPSFANEVYALKDEALMEKLAGMAKHKAEIEQAQAENHDLKSKRNELKVMNQTYTEPLKAIKLKSQLVVNTLKERGKA